MRRLPALLAAVLLSTAAAAQELRIGVEAGPTSNDPHFQALTADIAFSRHVFEPLILQDAEQRLTPGLATAWRALDDTTWEFELRRGVRWHDGSPFTAEDVRFTLSRAGNVPGSPSGFAVHVRPVREVEIVDPHRVRLRTALPAPLLPSHLSMVMMVSRRHGDGAATADYDAGRAMVGTGPYRFVTWEPGQLLVLARHDGHWSAAPGHPRVAFRAIPLAAARVAALRAGDMDLIERVPAEAFAALRGDPRFHAAESVSGRLVLLLLDAEREASPHVAARGGGAIANPLRDPRVRKAISKAIDREAIAAREMGGAALAAGDLAPPGHPAAAPGLAPEPFDPDGARALLRDAGMGEGFALTLHGPGEPQAAEEKVLQAIASMLARISVAARVETLPRAAYLSRAFRLEFSAMLAGVPPGPEVLGTLETLVHSWDPALGLGGGNRGRFSDRAIDALIQKARATVDDEARRRLTREATRAALAQAALVPLYFQRSMWATRRGLAYEARADEMTLATSVRVGH